MPRLLAVPLAAILAFSAASQPATDVPVERVILFTSGVGYFEHAGRVSGDADVTLRFEQEALNDVLKSLMVEDQGGRVAGVVYPTQAPIERTLGAFAVDLSDGPDLAAILRQVRGAEVTVTTPDGPVRGTVLTVSQQQRATGDTSVSVDVLSLLAPAGLVSVRLDTARRIAFADASLQAELDGALAALAEARSGDQKPVRLQFRGSGSRSVRMGYVIESPVWKTSYRLMLPASGESDGTLQGWALVENPTEADWTDVDLTLVSGRPVSFVTDLYTPRYVNRPVVVLDDDAVVRPESYALGVVADVVGGVRSDEDLRSEGERSIMSRGVSASPPPPPGEPAPMDGFVSVSAQGTAGDFGELFAYRLGAVTLQRRGSAMLPIVTGPVDAERLSIYSGTAGRHPMRGVRLTNTTDASLRSGPMTVLDEGYAGDAVLPDLPAGESRLLTFALDQSVLVDRFAVPGAASVIETATLRDGVLVVRRQGRSSQGYRIENRGDDARSILVEHPRQQGSTLQSPAAADETTPRLYRLRVDVAPGEVGSLVVVEARTLEERVVLSSISADRIAAYARASGNLPADVRRALERAIQDRRALAETERQLRALRQELADIENEQNRLRGNLQAVDNGSDYGRRLLDKLDEQETRIEQIQEDLNRLASLADRQREALSLTVAG